MTEDFSLLYTIPYFVATALYLLLFVLDQKFRENKKKHRAILLACPILFCIFWGMRGYVATDWKGYALLWENAEEWDVIKDEELEGGYLLLNWLLRQFFESYWVYQGITTVICAFALHHIFRRFSPYPVLSWAIWIAWFLQMHDLSRNIISLLICLYALRFVIEKRLYAYLSLITLALLFHNSAALWFPMYFLLSRRYSRRAYGLIICLGVLCSLFAIPIIKIFYPVAHLFVRDASIYTEGVYASSILTSHAHLLLIAVIGCLCVHFYKQIVVDSRFQLANNLFFMYFICFCFFNGNGEVQRRLGYLFKWSFCLVVPMIFQLMEEKKFKFISRVFVIVFCALGCRAYNNIMWHYENGIFMQRTEYEDRVLEIEDANQSASTIGKQE